MGISLSKFNNKLSFDFDTYIQEREELSRDLRGLATDAAWHRRVKGSWQVVQGTSGVIAGIAGGLALATAPITFGLSLPAVASTAVIVGNSVSAASLASSAACYGYEHVVDKDLAKRLMNLRHVIYCISVKDKEICTVFLPQTKKTTQEINDENKSIQTSQTATSSVPPPNQQNQKSIAAKEDPSASTKHGEQVTTQLTEETATKENEKSTAALKKRAPAIQACQNLCQAWDQWDLATKENKKVGFDFVLALVRSSGLILGTNSIIEGSKVVKEAHDLETVLLHTAEALEKETIKIRSLDPRYMSCIPVERKVPRGRLQHIDGGGGQVDMIVSYEHYGSQETLQSDSTRTIRLPEHAKHAKVTFRDRSGKMVKKVDRASKRQEWVKDESGKHELEVCEFSVADGADVVFVVKGTLTHAYIHKAWDFGRIGKPRSWEWWENVEEEFKLLPDMEQRMAARTDLNYSLPARRGALCCLMN